MSKIDKAGRKRNIDINIEKTCREKRIMRGGAREIKGKKEKSVGR